jgi:two-component sensor histidine kinase
MVPLANRLIWETLNTLDTKVCIKLLVRRDSLDAKLALALGVALHELGTNAAKYGALSNDEGYIEIAWTLAPHSQQGREFRLRCRERNGPPVTPPSRTGFGTRLIQRNLAAEFEGEVKLTYQPDGVECTIYAPVEGLGLNEAD